MKTKLFAIALAACILGTSACGGDAGAAPVIGSSVAESVANSRKQSATSKEDKKGNSSSEEKSNSSELSVQATQTDNKAIFEQLLNNPDDKEYFSPATNDYMYEITEMDSNQARITLYSFDEEGRLVQLVERIAFLNDNTHDNLEGVTISKDRKVAYYNETDSIIDRFGESQARGSGRSDKQGWETGRYNPSYSDKVYMSPGLTEYDTYMDSDSGVYSLDTLKELAEQYGSDYIIRADNELIKFDAFYHEIGDTKVLLNDAYEYTYCYVYVFDEQGECIAKLNVEAYGTPEMIEESWYTGGLGHVNEETGKRELDTNESYYKEFFEAHSIYKNLQYWINDETTKDYKWGNDYIPNPECNKTYYSVPYLTEKQLENLKANGYDLWN